MRSCSTASGARVLAAASTVQKDVAQGLKGTGNIEAARAVGRSIAERARAAGITRVAFDRAGFQLSRPHQGAGRSGA